MTDSLTFDPATINIVAGDTVRWVNVSAAVFHTATADGLRPRRAGFNSGKVDPGESFDFTFTLTGEFPYHCIPHGPTGMVGTVIVNASATALRHFVTATEEQGQVVVGWKVGARSDRAGFHVLRSTGWGDEFVPVNDSLIPGDPSGETVHTFIDGGVAPGTQYYYILEDVDTSGKSSFWGPATVVTRR